jgi:hypothetical protein
VYAFEKLLKYCWQCAIMRISFGIVAIIVSRRKSMRATTILIRGQQSSRTADMTILDASEKKWKRKKKAETERKRGKRKTNISPEIGHAFNGVRLTCVYPRVFALTRLCDIVPRRQTWGFTHLSNGSDIFRAIAKIKIRNLFDCWICARVVRRIRCYISIRVRI